MPHALSAPSRHTLKGILFDMDGVLFDSMPYHAISWEETAKKFKFDLPKIDVFRHEGRTAYGTVMMLAQQQWGRAATQAEIDAIYAEKCARFNAFPEAKKMKGADALLEKVRKSGLRMGIVTGSGQESLLQRIFTNFPDFFERDYIVSSKDCTEGKPSPEPYLLGLARTGLKASETIVVENAPLGVQAAVAAGIFTIAVNTGPLPAEELAEAGASLVYPSMQAFADDWTNFLSSLDSNNDLPTTLPTF